jgi:hypothetical protein
MMSLKNSTIITVVIVAVLLGGLVLAFTVPLIESEPVILESLESGRRLGSGYFIPIKLELEKGTVEFSYLVNKEVNGFIMTEGEYYGFAESLSGYTGVYRQ